MDGLPTVVIDNGTGYTKMGFAGNLEPSYIIPSVIATAQQNVNSNSFSLRLACVELIKSALLAIFAKP
jgi:actin-related protein